MSDTKPNILFVMADQLAARYLPFHGHPLVKTPALSRLAAEGIVFENCYSTSPLCSPARATVMNGLLPSRTGVYDNAAEFPSAIPTWAHYLRREGYRTCLSGKMHFVGPDQLHGFEDRVTTDMYPGDFGWTPTWDEPKKVHWWFHNMLSVTEAGPYDRSLEMEHDDEVAYTSMRWLHDHARGNDDRPFMLCVSFMQPHDPYLGPRRDWESYRDDDIDMPTVPFIPPDKRDPFSRRMWEMYDRGEYEVSEGHIRTARHGYYSMVSYADELLGRVLAPLERLGIADNTVVMVVADHGEMLGERGLWFKMVFLERSVRVPLIMSWPGVLGRRRVTQNASLIDILPTLTDIATGGSSPEPVAPIDGASMLPLARGDAKGWSDVVYGEYLAEGTTEPVFMIKRGTLKLIVAKGDPPQLYDTAADPHEQRNLAGDASHKKPMAAMLAEAAQRWDSDAIRAQVIATQKPRLMVQDALLIGRINPWDWEPRVDASKVYNRNYGGELYDTDRRARVPYRPEPPKTKRTRRNWSRDIK